MTKKANQLTKYRKSLLTAFKLNPIKIHSSTGLEYKEIFSHIAGEKTESATDYTMQSLYETLESEIIKINTKLNLVQ